VDDVDTNLYVAEGLLSSYKLSIETADSGFAAIDKVESGKTYDIIFMDHMMPKMDGIKTTHRLREAGYKGTIVALTANALVGNDKMFKQNGFDGFIAKPIDLKHLDEALNTYIRDKYPEEAVKYSLEKFDETAGPKITPKMLEIFRRDAEKAIITLLQTISNGDIKLFTTTVHAMKSALANVGESERSKTAAVLEKAGLDGDREFIITNTEKFITELEALVKTIQDASHSDSLNEEEIIEDTVYLQEQLQIIKTACEDYDDTAAYAALDRLKRKHWKTETAEALEEIRDALYLHSDFERALSLTQIDTKRTRISTN
jgi:CheY-like chemotaxis protein